MQVTQAELEVKSLGERRIPSPLNLSTTPDDMVADYVPDAARVLVDAETMAGSAASPLVYEKAGPRQQLFFDAARTRAGVVTCGGLCPGLNNVVRSLVMGLHYNYGVRDIIGFRYGYEGLNPEVGLDPMPLEPGSVRDIHNHGGSVLGLSRGNQPVPVMVDTLQRLGIDILFTVGGDGTLKGAHEIQVEAARRGMKLAVVGVPKTIDNDVGHLDKTFGFDTAVQVAKQALDAAHVEAVSARNGIGLVKLMGRDSGFIAAHSTLASNDVNYCLVPEVTFALDGPEGLLAAVESRLSRRGHALIAVAEGCGAALAGEKVERDASGNIRYAGGSTSDIGPLLRDSMGQYFKAKGIPVTIKYIDPSYMIRSVPANASDAVFCDQLARNAVHAAMAGKTDLVVGRQHNVFIHVPLPLATARRSKIDPDQALWLAVMESTGQPNMRPGSSNAHPR